jgi:hypothetical protein
MCHRTQVTTLTQKACRSLQADKNNVYISVIPRNIKLSLLSCYFCQFDVGYSMRLGSNCKGFDLGEGTWRSRYCSFTWWTSVHTVSKVGSVGFIAQGLDFHLQIYVGVNFKRTEGHVNETVFACRRTVCNFRSCTVRAHWTVCDSLFVVVFVLREGLACVRACAREVEGEGIAMRDVTTRVCNLPGVVGLPGTASSCQPHMILRSMNCSLYEYPKWEASCLLYTLGIAGSTPNTNFVLFLTS